MNEKVSAIIDILKDRYPEAPCALHYATDWQLMIAVRLSAHLVSLPSQKETAAEVLTEILPDPLFEDKKTLKDLLDQQLMRLQMQFAGAGHRYARTRALAMVTGDGAAREALSGGTYIRYVKQLCAADDAGLDALLVRLQKIASKAFTRSRMVISVSENGAELAERIPEAFPQGSAALRVDHGPRPGGPAHPSRHRLRGQGLQYGAPWRQLPRQPLRAGKHPEFQLSVE